jgi:hypothetical protein
MSTRDKIEIVLGPEYETIETKDFKKYYTANVEILYATKTPRSYTIFDRRDPEKLFVFNSLESAVQHFTAIDISQTR